MLHRNSSAGTAAPQSSKCSLIQRPAIILAMLLLCAVYSSSCNQKDWYADKKAIKVEVKDSLRYFFVAYDVSTPTIRSVGNFYHFSKTFPTNDSLKSIVYSMQKCETKCSLDQCIIVGFYEFKDSFDMMKFNGRPNTVGDVMDCDSVSTK
jgi:hypothetical protein